MAHAAIYERNRPTPVDPEKGRPLPVASVAGRLECSVSHVYNLISNNALPAKKFGLKKGFRVYEADLNEFVEKSDVSE